VAEAQAKAAEARADADASRAEADAARADADAARASAAVVECDAHFATALGCSHRVGAAEGSHRDPSLPAQGPTTVEIDFSAALVVRRPPLQPSLTLVAPPLLSPSFSRIAVRALLPAHCPPQPAATRALTQHASPLLWQVTSFSQRGAAGQSPPPARVGAVERVRSARIGRWPRGARGCHAVSSVHL
jgi:hypothetical protein